MLREKGRSEFRDSAVAFALVFAILMIIYGIIGFSPFGDKALTWEDANIQYLDFFAYFKDVLMGKNSITYSFGKTLGGNMIGVFSYYLSSPFSLLALLFSNENLHAFFNLAVALKLALSAATFSLFLNRRMFSQSGAQFDHRISVLLSAGYALSHYNVTQNSNLMWMDGVYLLPLILMAVYELVQGGKSWKLSVLVGISVIFNWYSAGINCLFSVLWMFFELALLASREKEEHSPRRGRKYAWIVLRYGLAIVVGLMLSAVLFLPTIFSLRKSGRGGLDWFVLKKIMFSGDWRSLFLNYAPGMRSDGGSPSLFCGSLALIGCVWYFVTGRIRRMEKAIAGALLMLMVASFYFWPLIGLFSLLKMCASYWYRYAYVGIFLVLFLAAQGFMRVKGKHTAFQGICIGGVCAGGVLFLHLRYHGMPRGVLWVYIAMLTATTIIAAAYFSKYGQARRKALLGTTLAVVVLCDLGFNAKLQMEYYQKSDVAVYQEYVEGQETQIALLKAADPTDYRVSQTRTRNMSEDRRTANYNEALSYNYMSIAGYTSSPDDNQRELLDRLGYRICGDNMCIVNTSILPADSLLGVKYILTDIPIQGLESVETLGVYNQKSIYENPYAMPMVFRYPENEQAARSKGNPFLYQNDLYSCLLGEEVVLFTPVEYQVTQEEDSVIGSSRIYSLSVPQGNYVLYGNIPWKQNAEASLDVNGYYETFYAGWLSPSVFHIPQDKGAGSAYVAIRDQEGYDWIDQVQFYSLDLDRLAEVTALLSGNRAEQLEIRNGYVRATVEAAKGDRLLVSIPYDSGWRIICNGHEAQYELFADCLYSLDLEPGVNEIEMVYQAEGVWSGGIISGLGLLLLVILFVAERKKLPRSTALSAE